jgi:hypothetical protein
LILDRGKTFELYALAGRDGVIETQRAFKQTPKIKGVLASEMPVGIRYLAITLTGFSNDMQ